MGDAKGYVYILVNPSFKDDWVKIGKSSREVNVRSKELDNTAVPLPFSIFATLKTDEPPRSRAPQYLKCYVSSNGGSFDRKFIIPSGLIPRSAYFD